jgi:heat-inducible transcriptional repressor
MVSDMSEPKRDLNERAQHLLKVLIERYIEDGQPIGSRSLSCEEGLSLSPATIRNVMADLEEMGLIQSPHTSAGRIPTSGGYRVFVDSLLTVQNVEQTTLNKVKLNDSAEKNNGEIIASASQLLSGVTKMAGVVSLPKRETASFRQIEFVPLSQSRVLAIMITNDDEVSNRIIHLKKEFKPAELQQASNYLNSLFSGQSLQRVKRIITKEMSDARQEMNQLMIDAISLAHQSMPDGVIKEDIVLSGETNLMDFQDLSNMNKLRDLFNAFNEKQGIIHLLDRCMDAEGVQIYIGEESGYDALDRCSLVTAPYAVDDEKLGVLGVIGPTRMEYHKVIPVVDVTAKILSSALKS